MPLGGMRVICIDGPDDARPSTPPTDRTAPTEHGSECDRLCPWPRPADSEDAPDCALTAGGDSFVVTGAASAPPVHILPQIQIVVSDADAEAPALYVEPALAHDTLPPKA